MYDYMKHRKNSKFITEERLNSCRGHSTETIKSHYVSLEDDSIQEFSSILSPSTYQNTQRNSKFSCKTPSSAFSIQHQNHGFSSKAHPDLHHLTHELSTLQQKHLETKENFQSDLQKANLSLQSVSKEATILKQTISELTSALHLSKNENGFLKEENSKLKQALSQNQNKFNSDVIIAKLNENHFIEVQDLKAKVEMEKILKKQIERDLEVALSHRQRIESALANKDKQENCEAKELRDHLMDLRNEKERFEKIEKELMEKVKVLERTLIDMYEENKICCDRVKELMAERSRFREVVEECGRTKEELKVAKRKIENVEKENCELKIMLEDLEKTMQEMIYEKEQNLNKQVRSLKQPTEPQNPKIPNLNLTMPDIQPISEGSLSTNRRDLPNPQKIRIQKAAETLLKHPNPKSQSPDNRSESFTFRKSTPCKDEVRHKIQSLMQNRSLIEKKLKILQDGQNLL